jgi:5-methylcytosine-specific restriction endonuclease McrA
VSVKSSYIGNWRFGFNREAVFERDGHRCVQCRMSRNEHKQRWDRDMTIDHIDGKGRYHLKEERNDDLSNLISLCLICHGKKDAARRTDYSTQAKGINHGRYVHGKSIGRIK